MVTQLIEWLADLPPILVYTVLAAGAAVENVMPAVPADTFVVLGGFLAAPEGGIQARWVFVATWLANVLSALWMYRMGWKYGRGFFEGDRGGRLLNPHQMARMQYFYQRWGALAIFMTRFLPGLRSVVPIFAGVSHQPFWGVAIPLAAASAVWYGALVSMGIFAGRNFAAVRAALSNVNGVLLGVALVVFSVVVAWWWRTRHHDH